jgi:dihydrofolate reductase
MARVTMDISTSLDGFVAGPNPTLEQPLGEGGEHLHQWLFRLAAFREQHGMTGGETDGDTAVFEKSTGAGAVVMGRRMFSGGEGPWKDDPNAGGWWGDDPPFHAPVFVLTHHPREPLVLQGGTTFTFVTDGVASAFEQASAAADGKDVALGGGASVARQFLQAGLLDELRIHLAPVLLGGGVRLFDGVGPDAAHFEIVSVTESPFVTHLELRVTEGGGI